MKWLGKVQVSRDKVSNYVGRNNGRNERKWRRTRLVGWLFLQYSI